ncbi:MAG: Na+:solute symporter [Bacteroidales bacterium]|nr:Na+:solute symporter [Bacteroidales bacterium]
MVLSLLDFIVIGAYILATVFIGLYFKKAAEKNKSEYLLGGNKLPWYMLGLSNASGMFDISGTMWLVTLMFVYGLKSIWIPWLWPTFNQIFLMMFLSAWLRKSNVTTGAEWIGTRFGNGTGSRLSHGVVIIFALLVGLSMLAYGFVGLGKFLTIFIPWSFVCEHLGLSQDIIPAQYVPHAYGIVFTIFATFYAIMGGMVSIVWADVMQYGIMTVSALVIGIVAMNQVTPGLLDSLTPNGWNSPFFGSVLDLDWSAKLHEVSQKIEEDGYSLFSLFFGFMFMKGILVSLAGPAPTYDMQKILATKSPKEAMKMSGSVSVVLSPVRYFMIAGFAVLAIINYDKLNLLVGDKVDFEQILPSAIVSFAPAGLMGLLLAGLLAAFMSTFAGTLNAAQAYVSNDIYLKFINPKATEKQIKSSNYTVGIGVVLLSTFLGFVLADVNEILQVVTGAFYASYIASNVLKWYWWRLNGEGYFWGMFTGILMGVIVGGIQLFAPEIITENFAFIPKNLIGLYLFPIILLISFIGCIIGTLSTAPTNPETLETFYKSIKPWGFWKPVYNSVKAKDPSFVRNKRFAIDMFNVLIGIIGQTTLVVLPIFIIIKEWNWLIATIIVGLISGIILKYTWWNKLDEI